jgi:hypothetical protein
MGLPSPPSRQALMRPSPAELGFETHELLRAVEEFATGLDDMPRLTDRHRDRLRPALSREPRRRGRRRVNRAAILSGIGLLTTKVFAYCGGSVKVDGVYRQHERSVLVLVDPDEPWWSWTSAWARASP